MSPDSPIVDNSSQGRYWDFMNGYDGSQGLMGNAGGDPIDPPAPGTGTSTGNAQGVIPAGQPGAGLPNNVDLPATPLNEVVVFNKSKSKSSSSYFQGYFDSYKHIDGTNPYSPYIPNATGFSLNGHVKTGLFGEFYLNLGIAFSGNKTAIFGSYGGNFGFNGTLGIPKFGFGVSYDMHDNYGGRTRNVLTGLDGLNKGYFGGLGLTGSYFKSARAEQYLWEKSGVSTTSIGIGIGWGGGMGISKSFILWHN